MTEQQLGEAITDLYDMERSNYHTMRMIQELDSRCSRLGIPKQFSPVNTHYVSQVKMDNVWRGLFFILGIVIGFIIVLVGELTEPGREDRSVFYWVGECILAFFLAVIIGCAIGFVLKLVGYIFDKRIYERKLEEEKQQWQAYYQQQIDNRSKAITQDNNRVQRELVVRSGLVAELNELKTQLQEGRQVIQTLYDDAAIDAAYRKLIPIRYMFDYYKLGISRKLEGTDGLYYLVRQELRADQFNASLQDISSKMNTLIKGQSEVYRELCEANNKSAKMVGELITQVNNMSSNMISEAVQIRGQIAKGTQVAEYAAKRKEAESSYLSYFASLRSQGIGISVK